MIGRILTPLDGTIAAEDGLAWAEKAAARADAAIHLCTVVDQPDPCDKALLDKAEEYLRSRSGQLHARGLTTEVEVIAGPAAETILDRAATADLTVMTYGTSRWLFGGVLDRVLRDMTTPTVIVRSLPGRTPTVAAQPIILIPLDTASYSREILAAARRLAEGVGASLVLCHIAAPVGPYRDTASAPPGLAQAIETLLSEAKDFLGQAAAQLGAPYVCVETTVTMGEAPGEILRIAARSGAGVIAMATRGRDRLSRVLGSVANSVVQSAHVPCLLVRCTEATLPRPSPQ